MSDFILACAGFMLGMAFVLTLTEARFLGSIFWLLGAVLLFLNISLKKEGLPE